ncbi:c-type cytochrome [Guyparkeria sp.]|uniref:c-type cytochrome n=1 Tax=Guyparkeria sp. TaxID=2035736 RepID=UPI003970E153
MKFKTLKTVVAVILVEIVLLAAIALIVIRTGVYNVAATEPHRDLTNRVLSTMMDNSVRRQASGIELSPSFSTPDLDVGFEHYQAMCVACHGAPGMKKSEVGEGLNPPAPNLSDTAADLSPQVVFWVLKNGIKMTGMPAFGPTHDDETLWNLTAFVKGLPAMTPDEYREMAEEAGDREPSNHQH